MSFVAAMATATEVAAAEAAAVAAAEIAAAEAATATAATAAASGIEAASLQQAAQAAMTSAAPTATMTSVAPAITGGIEGLGVGEAAATGVEQGIAQAMPTAAAPEVAAVPEVATAAPVATPVTPTGIEQIGPNMGQVNPMNYGNAVPGMPSTAPYGANYEQLSSVTNQAPSAFNTSAGSFQGVQGTPPSALERGFGKVMDWAEKNPLTALYAGSTMANALFAPEDEEPKKKPSSLSKYKLSPNFQPSRPVPNVYQPKYQSFAQGGIAALAGGTYPMGQQDNTQFATPTQMPTSAEVVSADYEQPTSPFSGEPVRMASGGVASPQYNYAPQSAFSQSSMNSPLFGKGGGMAAEPVDPLAKFVRAPNVAPDPYKPTYTPETRTPVGPPSNSYLLNAAAKWGGAQNLLNTYAPNLATSSPMAQSAAPAAAPAAPGFAKGGMPAPDIDTGIISEEDPDFAFTSPYKTAAGRLEKLYKKTHVPTKTTATAPELGAIDLTPANMKKAAQGGIMGADSSLGGYAHGGNARLLRGPGDGMSDDIPATIANKQPARLADGEFVIPADVVSHLGNGSTEAGAKHLHGMMDKVRKARTGRKAQGKQINPKKFMPK